MPEIKFIIRFRHSYCRCFSLHDLEVNVRYALAHHEVILGVEAL